MTAATGSPMTLAREDVYIANVLKCRPPDNRDPSEAENGRKQRREKKEDHRLAADAAHLAQIAQDRKSVV